MKIGTKLILSGILSILIGSAFASPLLISELKIRPFHEPLPKGPTADISVNVVYANFSIGDTDGNLTDVSYFVVLNITNNSDDWAQIDLVEFCAAQSITRGVANSVFMSKGYFVSGWEAKGAWVDGEWYNLTWVPFPGFYVYGEAICTEELMEGEGYWMEGVQLKDKYVNGTLTSTYMNMNGTWVDVTGRINVTRPDEDPFANAVTISGTIFSEMLIFGHGGLSGQEKMWGIQTITGAPIEFNNLWAPHQSRLIALSNRNLSKLLKPSTLEPLKTGKISFRGSVHSHLNGTAGLWDSHSVAEEIKQVQLEITEDGYLYNTILSEDQMFVTDSFGVEVFIEPRS